MSRFTFSELRCPPVLPIDEPYDDISRRFWAKVDRTGECWIWTACKSNGYGRFGLGPNRGAAIAHRFSYERLVGPIPEGLQLDHLCRNRACVNPAHLEPVTQRENLRRGVGITAMNTQKTHCVNGHHLSGDNLRVRAPSGRVCRACDAARARAYRARRSA